MRPFWRSFFTFSSQVCMIHINITYSSYGQRDLYVFFLSRSISWESWIPSLLTPPLRYLLKKLHHIKRNVELGERKYGQHKDHPFSTYAQFSEKLSLLTVAYQVVKNVILGGKYRVRNKRMILKVETDSPHIEPSSFKIKLPHISFWYLLEMGCGTITVPLGLSS